MQNDEIERADAGVLPLFPQQTARPTSIVNKTTFVLLAVAIVLFFIIRKLMELNS